MPQHREGVLLTQPSETSLPAAGPMQLGMGTQQWAQGLWGGPGCVQASSCFCGPHWTQASSCCWAGPCVNPVVEAPWAKQQ